MPKADGPGSGADRIEIRQLRVLGVHGALAEERQRAQPFTVDLDVWLDTAPAAGSDDLADTVDYAGLINLTVTLVAERSFALLEALAATLAEALLAADARIAGVSVTVAKLRPPLPHDVGSVGVRASRWRGTETAG
jgi:7,8-dihydroneopterin aldolase/epimerase/oxygenase